MASSPAMWRKVYIYFLYYCRHYICNHIYTFLRCVSSSRAVHAHNVVQGCFTNSKMKSIFSFSLQFERRTHQVSISPCWFKLYSSQLQAIRVGVEWGNLTMCCTQLLFGKFRTQKQSWRVAVVFFECNFEASWSNHFDMDVLDAHRTLNDVER